LAAEENTEIHIRFAIVMLFSALCFHRDPISLIERAPRWSQYNDTYKDYLGKPRENNVRSARPKGEKIQERLHGNITILIQLKSTPNVFCQTSMGPAPNNLLARFTAVKVPPQHPSQLRGSMVTLQRFGRVYRPNGG